MNTIYELLENLVHNGRKSYYRIEIPDTILKMNSVKKGQDICKEFISKHYKLGGKDECMMFDFLDDYLSKGKHLHTVSLYLMGIVFIENNSAIQKRIERSLQTFLCQQEYDEFYKKNKTDINYNYFYTWYLAALYHDVASCIEQAKIPENPTERQKSLEYYLGGLDITYSPYGNFPYRKENIPQRFSENLIKNYFYYRANSGSGEHGILAGYLFFDRFVKNFLKCWNPNNGHTKVSCGLVWHPWQISHAAYVADSIICHNIWMGGERDTELYQAYGLSPLLYTEHSENKLSIKNCPLQFMLCLLDTIEPLKRFAKKPYDGDVEPKEVLSHVYLEFGDYSVAVRWDEQIERNGEIFHKWCDALKGLQSWMEVRCETVGREITISWTGN